VGINKHEAQDMAQWVDWVWTFSNTIGPHRSNIIGAHGASCQSGSADIVFSICTDARIVDADAIKAWTNMWRGLPDAKDTWIGVLENAFLLEDVRRQDWRPYVGPGS